MPKIAIYKRTKDVRTVFRSPDHLESRVQSYFRDHLKQTHDIPDIEGLCVYLGITKRTLDEYGKKDKFADVVAFIYETILANQKQLAYRGAIKEGLFKFEVTNNQDYSNTKEVKKTVDKTVRNKVDNMTPEERRKEIKRLKRIAQSGKSNGKTKR